MYKRQLHPFGEGLFQLVGGDLPLLAAEVGQPAGPLPHPLLEGGPRVGAGKALQVLQHAVVDRLADKVGKDPAGRRLAGKIGPDQGCQPPHKAHQGAHKAPLGGRAGGDDDDEQGGQIVEQLSLIHI